MRCEEVRVVRIRLHFLVILAVSLGWPKATTSMPGHRKQFRCTVMVTQTPKPLADGCTTRPPFVFFLGSRFLCSVLRDLHHVSKAITDGLVLLAAQAPEVATDALDAQGPHLVQQADRVRAQTGRSLRQAGVVRRALRCPAPGFTSVRGEGSEQKRGKTRRA
jgi:hypothetical protein